MRTFLDPQYGTTDRAFTLDELIANLEALRAAHGGNVPVACLKDSSDTVHFLDGPGEYQASEVAWQPDERFRPGVVVLSIND